MVCPWPDTHGQLADRFVESLKLRHVTTACAYRSSMLGPFRRFVTEQLEEQPFGPSLIVSWLRAECAASPLERVVRHAQIVDRFLGWLVDQQCLAMNPVAELRDRYRLSTAALARACATLDPIRQLEALRSPAPFASHLGPLLRNHVARMQAAGYRYEPDRFLRFDRFLQGRPGAAAADLKTLVCEYAALAKTAKGHVDRLSVGRVVAGALRRTVDSVGHIDRPVALVREARRERRPPYIFTVAEIERCLSTARALCPKKGAALRPHALHLMLLLAYCAGLRRGELLRLRLKDVHHGIDEIEIRESKFFKSRRLPLAASVMERVRRYLALRRQAGASTDPESPLFWNELAGSGYGTTCVARWLTKVLRAAGVKPAAGRAGPRIHDLRRAFAIHRITDWYRRGVDVQARMPFLCAYMGHKNVNSTLTYLSMTPELLEEAGRRFRPLAARVLGS